MNLFPIYQFPLTARSLTVYMTQQLKIKLLEAGVFLLTLISFGVDSLL